MGYQDWPLGPLGLPLGYLRVLYNLALVILETERVFSLVSHQFYYQLPPTHWPLSVVQAHCINTIYPLCIGQLMGIKVKEREE